MSSTLTERLDTQRCRGVFRLGSDRCGVDFAPTDRSRRGPNTWPSQQEAIKITIRSTQLLSTVVWPSSSIRVRQEKN